MKFTDLHPGRTTLSLSVAAVLGVLANLIVRTWVDPGPVILTLTIGLPVGFAVGWWTAHYVKKNKGDL